MPRTEEHKAFHQTHQEIWYHGSHVAPHDLKNKKLTPQKAQTIAIQRSRPFISYEHSSQLFVTPSKKHAAYFATQYGGKHSSGYVYHFKKPKDIKKTKFIDEKDNKYIQHSIRPTHTQRVSKKRSTKSSGLGPHKYKYSDYSWSKKRAFK